MSHSAKAVVWRLASGRPADASLGLWRTGTTRTPRAHWMLPALGAPDLSPLIQSRTGAPLDTAYLRLNPRHKIPTLPRGALTLAESAAIIHYLAEIFDPPDRLFIPADARRRARLNEWCYFIMNELDGHALYVIRRHVGLKHIY